ncbi:MAG: Chaperone protein HtpG [Spirochaetes bacterium ADurb.Bin218]|jgi:molecular chaperone HtpG|nr:molecular chaperone HtpG [Spirochaetota bacterium]OQA97579.1 MAG: Chaperone protein HtpG [Spirochaetes bacterium ADurb.Bin218]HOV09069.1 molecular chaperone HtpG [Spirochaetota bacterium]HRS62905.1 molecular chaperone HtpG [Spirochaetota bacterium]HRU65358.1 molecular chaperone HtpG [Spirochaetota bacterium]
MSKKHFQTEVSKLLHLIIHSLYSHKEIFLRELVSNASDALDKLKFLNLTDEKYKSLKFDPRIDISFNFTEKTLSISDNGIGMNEQDLDENLGTIARSGTRNFVEKMTGDAKKDSNLIGQFGVGFYSAFMVADKVEVISKKAGEDSAWKWVSDGKEEYTIEPAERDSHGTTVTVHLNREGEEYANRWTIQSIIRKYSNHVPFPIYLHYEEIKYEGEGDNKKEIREPKVEQINSASAIWKRPKSELKEEDYLEFYRQISYDLEDPLLYIHTQAEGTLDYTTLFYIPAKAPMDLFRVDYQAGVKLYIKRVFITDDSKELMPTYLRFVRGIIDSEDLPLNVSREILQQNKVMAKIKSSSVKKILSELESLKNRDRFKYNIFWKEFGIPMKEGLYQDFENREKLLELVQYKSTKAEDYTTLSEYVDRMKPEQSAIYYITGGKEQLLRNSPLLEIYKEKDIEVLILDDEIDEIVISTVPKYKDYELKSVNRTDSEDDLKNNEDKEKEKKIEPLINKIKEQLGDRVKNVLASTRLSSSPSCIVADENDPTAQMQTILKMMGQSGLPEFKPVLLINPEHEIIKKLENTTDDSLINDVSLLLLEQAMLVEGLELKDPNGFVARLNRITSKAL